MPDDVVLSYVLPVHNDEDVLASNVGVLVDRLAQTRDAEIVLVENGSRDRSWEAAEALGGVRSGVTVLPFREENAGLGPGMGRMSRAVFGERRRRPQRRPIWVCRE